MTLRQRLWACVAVALAGGMLASGLGRWSVQTVFAACALWLLWGPLMGEAALGALRLSQLWQRAAWLQEGARPPTVPYARARSPLARLQLASVLAPAESVLATPGRSLLWTILTAGLALALASLFTRQIALYASIALATALICGALIRSEALLSAIVAAGAWSSGLALLGLTQPLPALAGGLVAVLLAASLHPSPGRIWRGLHIASGLALGALLAKAQQPALGGLLFVASLASMATPMRLGQPWPLQLAAALGGLLAGLAVGHWG